METLSPSHWYTHRWWYWLILLAAALLGILAIFFANARFLREYQQSQETFAVVPKAQSVTVRISIQLEKLRVFEGDALAGMTVGSALREISETARLDLAIKNGVISELGGKKSGKSGAWTVSLNGRILARPADALLKGGDRLELRYQ